MVGNGWKQLEIDGNGLAVRAGNGYDIFSNGWNGLEMT